jgi:hypothetical protein
MQLFVIVGLLLLAAPVSAQTPTPTAVACFTPTPTAAATATPTATPIAKVPQQRKIAVFLVNSPDGTHYLSSEEMEDWVWTNPIEGVCDLTLPSVRSRYLLGSYGIVDFVGDVDDIFGPYETEWLAAEVVDNDHNCHYNDWSDAAMAAAIEAEDLTSEEMDAYDHLVFVLPWVDEPPGPNPCDFGGLGYLNGRILYLSTTGTRGFVHEIGHNMGFPVHIYDSTSLNGPSSHGMSVPNLIHLDLLPSTSIAEIESHLQQEFSLLPISVDPYDVPGERVVKIEFASGDPYYISFRDNTGMDICITDPEINELAVHVHRWDGIRALEVLGPFKQGETFTEVDGKMTVEVTDISEGEEHWGATVEVTFFPNGVLY